MNIHSCGIFIRRFRFRHTPIAEPHYLRSAYDDHLKVLSNPHPQIDEGFVIGFRWLNLYDSPGVYYDQEALGEKLPDPGGIPNDGQVPLVTHDMPV